MVPAVVNGIDTDRVDAEVDEVRDVALQACGVEKGVGSVGRTARLIGDAADVKALAVGVEGVALDCNLSCAIRGKVLTSIEGIIVLEAESPAGA